MLLSGEMEYLTQYEMHSTVYIPAKYKCLFTAEKPNWYKKVLS